MGKTSNRAVREELNLSIAPNQKKYIGLLISYETKIEEFKIEEEYEKFLYNLIINSKPYDKFDENFKTQTRKRMLSLLLYIHWKLKEDRPKLNTFFDLWHLIYPENPLPEGVKRKRGNKSQKALSAGDIVKKKVKLENGKKNKISKKEQLKNISKQ